MLRLFVISCVLGLAGVSLAKDTDDAIEKLPRPHYREQDSDPSWLKMRRNFMVISARCWCSGARVGMAALRAVDAKGYFDVEIRCEGPMAKPPAFGLLPRRTAELAPAPQWENETWSGLTARRSLCTPKIQKPEQPPCCSLPTPSSPLLRQPPVDAKGMSEPQRREQSRKSHHADELSRKIAAMPEKEIVNVSYPPKSK